MSSNFAAFAARRALSALVLVAVVSSFSLVLVRLAPGDATTELALSGVDPATIAATRARLGLDRPIATQLVSWVRGVFLFDLGESSTFGRPVADLVGERALNTARLAGVALAAALIVGVPVGLITGAKPRGVFAACVAPISIALVSCPPIVGVLALMVLAIQTQWFSVAPGAIALPAIALSLPVAAMIERVQSRATAEVIGTTSWNAAAARGVPQWRLLWIHAARQSSRPVLGLFGVILGSLFSGSLAVEWVSSWPGLGRLMYDAIVGRDVFLVAGCALAGAVLVAAGNFIADVLRGVADPRVTVS
jgi:peptide/nickel transport system permease protein